jgi:hypothetical protein
VVGLQCLVSQCAKLYVAGWPWEVFTHVYFRVVYFDIAPVREFLDTSSCASRAQIQILASLNK